MGIHVNSCFVKEKGKYMKNTKKVLPKKPLTQARASIIVACITAIAGIFYALLQFLHPQLPSQIFVVQQSSTPATVSSSCTDAQYVDDFYHLAYPYPLAKDWFSWLTNQGWIHDANPNFNDIIVVNANKQGFGASGYVGIVQQPITSTGSKTWTMTVRSTGLPGGTPVADTHCSNVADYSLNISAGMGDGVAFFHK